jgi:hypothetical protein
MIDALSQAALLSWTIVLKHPTGRHCLTLAETPSWIAMVTASAGNSEAGLICPYVNETTDPAAARYMEQTHLKKLIFAQLKSFRVALNEAFQ